MGLIRGIHKARRLEALSSQPVAAYQEPGGHLGKVVAFIGATLGGAAGWWLGARLGVMTAFILSTVGTGAGIYGARRWLRNYLP